MRRACARPWAPTARRPDRACRRTRTPPRWRCTRWPGSAPSRSGRACWASGPVALLHLARRAGHLHHGQRPRARRARPVVAARPDLGPTYRALMAAVVGWLAERQNPDGWWRDRWHASRLLRDRLLRAGPACAFTLHGLGADRPVRRAVGWVLGTQRADGSWGRWGPSAEETAYAVLTLRPRPGRGRRRAPARRRRRAPAAYPHLVAGLHDPVDRAPALWHDKDLYRPHAIVQAVVLAAIDTCQACVSCGRGRSRDHRGGDPMRRTQSLRTTTDRC